MTIGKFLLSEEPLSAEDPEKCVRFNALTVRVYFDENGRLREGTRSKGN
jgi:hypothetical protein